MAVADDDVDGAEKSSTFRRCLDAARLLVAVAVTVLIVAIIGHAVSVVLRPGELTLWVKEGFVSVKRSHDNNLTKPYEYLIGVGNLSFTYTIRAVNPSGRVRIYYTKITAKLQAKNSSTVVNSFQNVRLPDMALAPDSTLDTNVQREMPPKPIPFLEEYFKVFGSGSSIDEAWLELNGTRTVENFSGHNMSGVPATYYCWPLVVGGEQDDGGKAANDVVCNDIAPTGASS